MDTNTIATYAILITGALLLMVGAYYLLRAFVRGAALLVKATFDVLKIAFKTLYFLLILVLIAGGIQILLTAIRSFPAHALYRAAWACVGVYSVATGALALALRMRDHSRRRRGEPSIPGSPEEEPAFPYSASDPEIKGKENEELSWKRQEEEELQRQFQLMKAKQVERELVYQNWVADQEEKDRWRQEQSETAERNRKYWDRFRREEG